MGHKLPHARMSWSRLGGGLFDGEDVSYSFSCGWLVGTRLGHSVIFTPDGGFMQAAPFPGYAFIEQIRTRFPEEQFS